MYIFSESICHNFGVFVRVISDSISVYDLSRSQCTCISRIPSFEIFSALLQRSRPIKFIVNGDRRCVLKRSVSAVSCT